MLSALARSRRSWEIFGALVERQMRLRVKRTLLGVVWPLATPLFLLVLYVFVFHSVFDVPIARYPEYLFAGLLPWTFMSQSVGLSLPSISNEPELIRRSKFAYELVAIAQAAVMLIYFAVLLVAFLAYLALTGHLRWAVLPVLAVPVGALVIFVVALSSLAALYDVYNRDLRQLLSNVLTIWFFLVPIVYRPAMAPGALRAVHVVDPMNIVVQECRDVLYYGRLPGLGQMLYLVALSLAFFAAARLLHLRTSAELPKII